MPNTTGWAELMNGDMIGAVYTMYDTAFGNLGIVVVLLFFTYQFMLYSKTQNLALTWAMGVLFAAMYVGTSVAIADGTAPFVNLGAVSVIFLLLTLELAAMLYNAFFGDD